MRYARKNTDDRRTSPAYAIPFFLVLTVLTVVAFIIPLRPTQSQSEKRELAAFPEFSLEALTSGTYYDDISTWFSDTFPGRESGLNVSAAVSSLHGWSDVVIHGDIQIHDPIPPATGAPETSEAETEPATEEPTEIPEETVPPTEQQIIEAPTDPVEEWGGIDAGDGAEISLGAAIQIGDFAFTYYGFSQWGTDVYINVINSFAEKMKDNTDVNIIHCVPPTAVGIMAENKYLEKLHCSPQDEALAYIAERMAENVISIDTFGALIDHNSEYLYFRTDHHWTALAAYYVYEEFCLTMGYEPAPLDSFEVLDQGEFKGSLYYKCNQSSKLRVDNVISYIPQGDITTLICKTGNAGFEWPLIADMSKKDIGTKYMCFLSGDHAMTIITNDSLPDAPNCVVVKDSFGNCFVPFLSQNYHNVYVLDYRQYTTMRMTAFIDHYDIQDVIIMPNLGMASDGTVCDLLKGMLR